MEQFITGLAVLVLSYALARVTSNAYFSEKLHYHKRLLEAMKKEEDDNGKQVKQR